jgi:hypothetical protein
MSDNSGAGGGSSITGSSGSGSESKSGDVPPESEQALMATMIEKRKIIENKLNRIEFGVL